MSYLKMLGLGARGKLSAAAGLFSTAVISGSSSAPNLRVMIPSADNDTPGLEGFGGVPAIRPLETLHNALSLRQLDAFLERVAAAPVLLGNNNKHPSPTNSMGWSGSSSGEPPSALSSAGPSSPNSNYAYCSDSSNWSRARAQWEGGERPQPVRARDKHHGSSVSGDVTPVSIASELEFNSNEATAGSITDNDILSAEGEDDEETTLSMDNCAFKDDLTYYKLDATQPYYKNIPTNTNNIFNVNADTNKILPKENVQNNLEALSVPKGKKYNEHGSRRYSDSSAIRNNLGSQTSSRFTTTLVTEDMFRPSTSGENNHQPESS